jgi:hypothetical protein
MTSSSVPLGPSRSAWIRKADSNRSMSMTSSLGRHDNAEQASLGRRPDSSGTSIGLRITISRDASRSRRLTFGTRRHGVKVPLSQR